MKLYVKFIAYGLVVGLLGEFLNNFVIHFAPGNFIFAAIFYAIMLSGTFLVFHFFLQKKFPSRMYLYIIVTGVGVGLIFNEWMLVGNHPYNPNVSHPITQLSMISFHASLYTTPILLLFSKGFSSHFKRFIYGMLFVIIIGLLLRVLGYHPFVLPWGIFMAYFIGYNIYFLSIIRYIKKLPR